MIYVLIHSESVHSPHTQTVSPQKQGWRSELGRKMTGNNLGNQRGWKRNIQLFQIIGNESDGERKIDSLFFLINEECQCEEEDERVSWRGTISEGINMTTLASCFYDALINHTHTHTVRNMYIHAVWHASSSLQHQSSVKTCGVQSICRILNSITLLDRYPYWVNSMEAHHKQRSLNHSLFLLGIGYKEWRAT